MLLRRPKERRVGFSLLFWACAICTAFFGHPLTNRLSTVRTLQWVFSAEDKPALSPHMPVLHALNRIVGDYPDTFFSQSERQKKVVHLQRPLLDGASVTCFSTTSTSVWQRGINVFRQACVYSVLFSERWHGFISYRHIPRAQSLRADKLVMAFLEIC